MLKRRMLGRSRHEVPPVIWRIGDEPLDPSVALSAHEAGSNWIYLPAAVNSQLLERVGPQLSAVGEWSLLLGITAAGLHPRAAGWVEARVAAFGLRRCEGIVIESADPGQIKSGGPFHRLMQLRDRGLTELSIVEADDTATAEWLVENTPSHAIILPFGLGDPSARYRVLDAAAELQVAVLTTSTVAARWTPPQPVTDATDLAFVAAHPQVSSTLRRMPASVAELHDLLALLSNPMSDDDRDRWWSAYQREVPPPPKPVRNLPPEFGS